MSSGFSMPARPLIRLESKSGNISVVLEDRGDVLVESGIKNTSDAKVDADELILRNHSGNISVRCPAGTNLNIGTISGSVRAKGRAGDIRVGTASGNIEIDGAERADLRSISGKLSVAWCGTCRLATKSGRVEIGSTFDADLATVSGNIGLTHAEGRVRVKTVSGKVELGAAGRRDIEVHSLSGSVTVRLPPGTRPEIKTKSLGGRTRSEFAPGNDCRVAVSTLSGRIDLVET
ncbi:MAG: DUF4097 family beta strand repeat-containing protein [Hyphomicrobiales bacterium]